MGGEHVQPLQFDIAFRCQCMGQAVRPRREIADCLLAIEQQPYGAERIFQLTTLWSG
ncbi:hypothetical protein D3C81_1940210 [compost metagenome]